MATLHNGPEEADRVALRIHHILLEGAQRIHGLPCRCADRQNDPVLCEFNVRRECGCCRIMGDHRREILVHHPDETGTIAGDAEFLGRQGRCRLAGARGSAQQQSQRRGCNHDQLHNILLIS